LGLGTGGLRYYKDPLPHAHSIYFSTLFDFGVIGALLLVGLIIALITKLFKLISYQTTYAQIMLVASTGSLLVVGVHGLVDFNYLDYIVWWTLGMVTATILLVDHERRPSTAAVQALNL
jgi:O-antigen ligase